ncbi:hypothetical protein FIS3754_44570 [Fischerella sp. NIES-3754]|nr:hypothetical protein FIS3754_44570 [Fischerella sp. NIES-3754]BCX10891.1 MAG: hypothetical protein KatS3mg066_4750 [Fischerella sp.]
MDSYCYAAAFSPNTKMRLELPKQLYMTYLIQKYFDQRHNSNYKLDDYIIIAKK